MLQPSYVQLFNLLVVAKIDIVFLVILQITFPAS